MNILVSTDFSETSKNAMLYAASLAKELKAKIMLYHFFTIPIPIAETPVYIDVVELEKQSNELLLKEVRTIHDTFGKDIDVEFHCKSGEAQHEICTLAENNAIDLIVLGMRGINTRLERMFGSVTTGVMTHTDCPVLVVPKGVTYKSNSTIALASDLTKDLHADPILKLKKFLSLWNVKLQVVHVVSPSETVDINQAIGGMKLENLLSDMSHSLHFPEANDLMEGLNKYASENKIDMFVTIPQKHSFIDSLLHESKSKKLAYFAEIPLLSIRN